MAATFQKYLFLVLGVESFFILYVRVLQIMLSCAKTPCILIAKPTP